MRAFEVKTTEEQTLSREGTTRLRVRTAVSSIRISGAETDQLQVRATKKVRAATEALAQAFLEQMEVVIQRDGDCWAVEATWPQPRPQGIESAGVSFEIQVPHGFDLEARSSNGSIDATGIGAGHLRTSNGSIAAREVATGLEALTSNGSIRTEQCTGPAELKSENGRIEVRQLQGALKATTSNGSIHVEECAGPVELATENARIEARRIGNELNLRTSNGAIHVEECAGSVEARTSCGGITIRQAGSPLRAVTSEGPIHLELQSGPAVVHAELTTRNGPIDARLPAQTSARLVADTSNARINLDPPAANARFGPGPSHLETVLGSGEGSIRLQTCNGPIHIRLAG